VRATKPPEPLRHGRVPLALHALREAEGEPLLCLHALGGRAADWAEAAVAWPGPVYALDFAGHGASGWLSGGGYTPELLAGDADVALARLGTARVAGAGIGAYVALLLAGARPEHVPGALLLPGAGLGGGGGEPDPAFEPSLEWTRLRGEPPSPGERPPCDPFTTQLEREFRPPDYAAAFAARASRLLLLEDGEPRPPWWQATAGAASAERVEAASAAAALARLAAV
jgi:pimeloyl-ACP methyl ester carboxylesterase